VRRILLVGAGHAHLAVLRSFATTPVYGVRLTLVTPLAKQVYSGMLPGVIAGHYRLDDAQVDNEALCGRAFAEFSRGRVTRLDLQARRAQLEDGSALEYDAVSLNPGSLVEDSLPGAQRTLAVKPLDAFLGALDERKLGRVAIVGGARIPFARAHGAYARIGNQEMLTAAWNSLLIGLVDTFGKVLVPEYAGVAVYVLMAAILLWRPEGLFRRG